MIAYKGFRPGLICRGYQFVMGLNTTEKANCRENGFHCAEDPLDCLSYSFFFEGYMVQGAKTCGGVILHGEENIQTAKYGIHT